LAKEPAATAIPALAEFLKDEDWGVRGRAAKALVAFGPPAAPVLAAALKKPPRPLEYVSFKMLMGLDVHDALLARGDLGPLARELMPALMETLKDKYIEARVLGILILGNQGAAAKSALPTLIEAAADVRAVPGSWAADLPSGISEAAVVAAL